MRTFGSTTFNRYVEKWLVRTAVFELLLAGGFMGAAVVVPEARFGFFLTGGILGGVGLALLYYGLRAGRKAEEVERIETTGLAGQAAITGLTQTGMSLNDNPQVEFDLSVDVPGRASYAAKRKEFVPLIMLGQIAPGAVFPVKIDPADPSNVVIEWQGAPAARMPAQTAWPAGTGGPGAASPETLQQVQDLATGTGIGSIGDLSVSGSGGVSLGQLRAYLDANGLSGWGTLDEVTDTGKTIGPDKVFSIAMTVHVDGKASYRSDSLALVPAAVVSKVVRGTSVPVKVAPDNPDVIHIEWEKV
jgi:hypothetical protein